MRKLIVETLRGLCLFALACLLVRWPALEAPRPQNLILGAPSAPVSVRALNAQDLPAASEPPDLTAQHAADQRKIAELLAELHRCWEPSARAVDRSTR